jgi:nicotinate phosphoribosyltransferase
MDIYEVESFLFTSRDPTVTDFTADAVRVKVHNERIPMSKVGRSPGKNPDLERVW